MNIDAFNGTNDSEFLESFKFSGVSSVAADDLQMVGGRGVGEGGVITFFFRPFEPQLGLKIRGEGGGGWSPPLDPPPKLNFSTSTSATL